MEKRLGRITFDESSEAIQFVNDNKIPREDVVNLSKGRGLLSDACLDVYLSNPEIIRKAHAQNKYMDKHNFSNLVFSFVVVLLLLAGGFVVAILTKNEAFVIIGINVGLLVLMLMAYINDWLKGRNKKKKAKKKK